VLINATLMKVQTCEVSHAWLHQVRGYLLKSIVKEGVTYEIFILKSLVDLLNMADDLQEARKLVFGGAQPNPRDVVKYLGLVRSHSNTSDVRSCAFNILKYYFRFVMGILHAPKKYIS